MPLLQTNLRPRLPKKKAPAKKKKATPEAASKYAAQAPAPTNPGGRKTALASSRTPRRPQQPENPAPPTEQLGKYITMDFDNVDIGVFVKFMSEMTHRNFVIDDNVKGKISVFSPRKISFDEAYKVFESVLEIHGLDGTFR